MKYISKPIRKKDAMALVTGKPVYTDDLAAKECLIVKLLRSPHAHAWIEEINTAAAEKMEGIEAVFTYKDVPNNRFTIAGQTYPQMSPYDRLILDRHLRYVGDPVAIVAGVSEEVVDKAMKRIKVKYKVEKPLLKMEEAIESEVCVHPEEDWKILIPFAPDHDHNVIGHEEVGEGDVDEVLASCAYTVDRTYRTKANNQTMMETFRTYCSYDHFGRLVVVSSTQIAFHVRRIIGEALNIPSSKVRVIKPRIGGGFGAKQSAVMEVYPSFVTWKTRKPCKMIYSRAESMTNGSPRHEMLMRVRVGCDADGIVKAIDLYSLSNAGAYGEHSTATIGLSGHKSIPLYRHTKAHRFIWDCVYTNTMPGGAYRGFGATQGIYAVESAVNELAAKIGMDPVKIRELNMPVEGGPLHCYDNPIASSCAIDRCMARAKEMMDWDNKYPRRIMPDGKIRAVGVSMALQGSSIAGVDVGGADIRLNEDGSYTLALGCADMGTGCDTILSQMAAECLKTDLDNISVFSVDTDASPYDSGSYASSTTYLTGMAVVKACGQMIEKIREFAASRFETDPENVDFDGEKVFFEEKKMTLRELAAAHTCFDNHELHVSTQHTGPYSPPPYMVGMAEIELDPETGFVEVLDYVAVVDCGTVINSNLARVQTEGGIVQGIGMALFEEVAFNEKGKSLACNFMQYKIPTRMDIGKIRVDFESSYEPTGPFGAKSIGELVIDTPCPTIANAIYNACGVHLYELPMTPERVLKGMMELEKKGEAKWA